MSSHAGTVSMVSILQLQCYGNVQDFSLINMRCIHVKRRLNMLMKRKLMTVIGKKKVIRISTGVKGVVGCILYSVHAVH